jgi:hypothetical protein
MGDLACPGCGGSLPDCPCRSGLTAGTFSNASAPKPPTLADLISAWDALQPPLRFTKIASHRLLTGDQHWVDERAGVLFVSPEAFEDLSKRLPGREARDG